MLSREQRDSQAGNQTNAAHTTESANNSLRAVSSSFSANESLNQESLPSVDGGGHDTANAKGLASKHSPGVVTAVDSVERECIHHRVLCFFRGGNLQLSFVFFLGMALKCKCGLVLLLMDTVL